MTRYDEFPNVEARDADWRARAIKWSAFILVQGQRTREEFNSLREAAACAQQYEEVCARNGLPNKRALVYAITAEGHATLVPREVWQATLEKKPPTPSVRR
jgi:hypothetical protein